MPAVEIEIVKRMKHGRVLLRCECQATFVRPEKRVKVAVRNGKPLKCPACDPADWAETMVAKLRGERGFRDAEPRTATATECVRLMRAGVNYIDAAERTGMRPQSADKLYFRWVIFAENQRLKNENEQLRARLLAAGAA